MQIILAILLLFACGNQADDVASVEGCQVCQSANLVYCHNQTSYQNCMKNSPFGDVQQCPEGTVCTNDVDVCVETTDGTTIKDVCGSDSACESCAGSPLYACVSSTQFARCKGTTLITSTIYSCAEDEVCYQEGFEAHDTVCVPSCALEYLGVKATCTNNEFTTTTTTAAPPTTPSADEEQSICSAAASPTATDATSTTASTVTQFFYTRNTGDKTCSTYLYCQKGPKDTEWDTVFFTCSAPKQYFDSTTKSCVATKPTGC